MAGSTLIGVSVAEMRDVSIGWSAKRQILGQAVFNDKDERIGSIDDIIIAPDKAVSYAIINAGGFTGLTKHDVAIPVSQLKLVRPYDCHRTRRQPHQGCRFNRGR